MLKFAVTFAPLALVAVWGGTYLLDCVRTLESPGIPFEVDFQSQSGNLKVIAQSYSLAPFRGTLIITKPKVIDQSGNVIAQMDSVEATGFSLSRKSEGVLHIKGRNLKGRLTRLKDGSFDLQKFLPQQTSGGNAVPYDVEINRGTIQFTDLDGNSPWTRTVNLAKVFVSGVGQDWLATANAEIVGSGGVQLKLQNLQNEGLRISGATQSLELASVLTHLYQTPLGRGFRLPATPSLKSLVVRGPFSIFVPRGKQAIIEAHVTAAATDLRYQGYAAAEASFDGVVRTDGAYGSVEVHEGESVVKFRGSSTWTHGPNINGQVSLSVPSSVSLPSWVKTALPAGTSFMSGEFQGWVSASSLQSYHISGEATALTASAAGHTLQDIGVGLDLTKDQQVAQVKRAKCASGPLTGLVSIDTHLKTIKGILSLTNADLEDLGGQFGYKQVSGTVSGSVLLEGDLAKPSVKFEAHGQGVANIVKDHTVSLGNFEAAGSYSNGEVRLDQAYINTAYGLLVAKGALGASGSLGIDVTGRGLRPVEYDQNLGGAANLRARVTGTLKAPVATGRIEGSDLAYKSNTIEALVANFKVDKRHLEVSGLEAARGTASASGFAQLEFRSGRLSGAISATDIQVAEWLGVDFVGAVDAPSMVVSGTLTHPVVSGPIQADSLIAKGLKLNGLAATLDLDGTRLLANHVHMAAAGGSVTGAVDYDLAKRTGQVTVEAADLDLKQMYLERFLPKTDASLAINGKVSGKAKALLDNGNLLDVTADGSLTGLSINQTLVGGGSWQAGWINRVFTGNLEVGALDRFVELNNVVFDPDAKRLKGDLSVLHFQVEDIIDKALPYFPDLSYQASDSLTAIHGLVNLGCTFEGTLADPNVSVSSLQVSDISYRGHPLGVLDTAFELKSHRWDISSFTLDKGPAKFSMKGTIDERGETHLDATSDNRFDLSALATLDPRVSRLTGTAHLWMSADGPSSSPRIVASLNVDNLLAPPGVSQKEVADDKNLRFELENIVIDPANTTGPAIEVKGAYFFKGFKGTIAGTAPIAYPFTIPDNQQIEADISFNKSDLKEVAALVGGLDAAKTSGSVEGAFKIKGTRDLLHLTGNMALGAKAIAFGGLEDGLQNVKADLGITNEGMTVTANADTSRGGTASATASIPVDDLRKIFDQIQQSGPAVLLDRPLKGSLTLTDVAFKQKILGQSSVAGEINSQVEIGGTLQKPVLTGDLAVGSGDVVFKGLPPGARSTFDPAIDPSFDVNLKLNSPARVRSATADISMVGSGKLKGSLANPRLDALVTVEKGTVRLPATLLRLEQGGSVRINYGIQGATSASAVVDLEGNTSVTASRYGDFEVQRYDITLGMKGDLLQDKGLNLTASSDPPDLTQDRILGILGETELLQTLSSAGKETSAVQTALLSAVPTLLDPWTSQVALGLGLDYLNLEYNAFDLASLTFGKILGSGFSIEGNRQLSEPQPGVASRYDLRILYRPRRLLGALSQFRIFFGADQLNPWKVGIEYGFRF